MSNKNTRHLHIELTPEQYQLLNAQAKQCALTKRAYIVRLLEGSPVRPRPASEIKALRTEIHYIGNNINRALVRAIANPTWQSGSKTLILRVIH